jgi:hypothetical protein
MYDVVVETARADNRKQAHRRLMKTEARPGDLKATRLTMIAQARRSLGTVIVRAGAVLQGAPVRGLDAPRTGGMPHLGH